MVHSAVWSVQDALLDVITTALHADPETSKLRVSLGVPPKPGKEEVWISGEINEWSQSYPYSGLTAKEEQFSLRIAIISTRLGLDYVGNRDRVALIGRIIEDAIHADPTLGGACELVKVGSAMLEEAILGERERAVGLNLDVDVRTHLTA